MRVIQVLIGTILVVASCYSIDEPSETTKIKLEVEGSSQLEHIIELQKSFYTISLNTEYRKIETIKIHDGQRYEMEFTQEKSDLYKLVYSETERTNEMCVDPDEIQIKVGRDNIAIFTNRCK